LFLRFRCFRSPLALGCLIAVVPTPVLSASRDACSVVTRADVGIAVGRGAVTSGKLRRYAGETASECQYDTDAGNVVVSLFPDKGDRLFAAVQGSYGSLQTVPGMGDDAVYSKERATLAIRKGRSAMLLTLATPEVGRGHAILMALGRRPAATPSPLGPALIDHVFTDDGEVNYCFMHDGFRSRERFIRESYDIKPVHLRTGQRLVILRAHTACLCGAQNCPVSAYVRAGENVQLALSVPAIDARFDKNGTAVIMSHNSALRAFARPTSFIRPGTYVRRASS
jgi:hypothetical protein